jgi:predicted DNA-binding transcriptional regulator AlpA
MAPVEVVGVPEIGRILGVSRQRVYQLMDAYDDFPQPLATLAVGRVWSRAAVEDWDRRHSDRSTGRHRRLRLEDDFGPDKS